jgi:hypothetical protein
VRGLAQVDGAFTILLDADRLFSLEELAAGGGE